MLSDLYLDTVRLFISKDPKIRKLDFFRAFHGDVNSERMDKYEEIYIHKFLFEKRQRWISRNLENIEYMQQHCLDPEYGQQPHPTCDILFTTVPECMKHCSGFKLTPNFPKENSVFGLLAYHHPIESLDADAYKETTSADCLKKYKDNSQLNYHRTICLGRVKHPGSIYTVLCTAEEVSQGGCLVDENLDVFAILFGSYYDDPTKSYYRPYFDPTLQDVYIPEIGDSMKIKSRNRNLALSLSHPFVFRCLLDLRSYYLEKKESNSKPGSMDWY
eukprot:TRINITY_DN2222_c0_g1_i11.p1 TRINITY_DN2222_c0_g1~~TRINITY_DN2222_c0_g1_i11.p1  ORF type:complete len:273 (-),score=43.48 TRINITY_DN2222_c0_g1_i11:136-954(-)